MIVEFLTFSVDAADLPRWLEVEREVWTGYLQTVPGFVRKEVWQDPARADSVHAVIWWESRQAWQAISREQVAAVDERVGEGYREPTAREFTVVG